jgi:predicted TIM-barrel fold metal-dependent hydrolase
VIVDTNVYLSRWPTRRLPGDSTSKLVEKLRTKDVAQAWVGSFDGLLHADIGQVNRGLAEECREFGQDLLKPFGTVNPTLPDWEEDLRRCHEDYQMPGIRLHPNYHGYKLDDPIAARLLAAAAEYNLLVQIALRMEDPRTQHRLLAVPDVDAAALRTLLPKTPNLRVELLNALNVLRPDAVDQILAAGRVSVEIAMLEGVNGLSRLLEHTSVDRILFGSYFPFFGWESAELKLRESALTAMHRTAISGSNAAALLAAPSRQSE